MEAENKKFGLQNNSAKDYLPGVHPNKNIKTSREEGGKLAHGTENKISAMNPDGTEQLTKDELATIPELDSDALEDMEKDIEDLTAEAVEDLN